MIRNVISKNVFLWTLSSLALVLALSQMAFNYQGTERRSLKDTERKEAVVAYQGELRESGVAANGAYDLQFSLHTAQTGGTELGSITYEGIVLTNGLFTVPLDFGGMALESRERWLEVSVRPGGSAEPYTVLYPRQKLTSSPAAISAEGELWSLVAVPVTLSAQPAGSVPIGAVIDWWRPNATFPIPEGFQICDGSLVTDPASPFFGLALPDLRNRFVRGVSTIANIGEMGGDVSHDHTVDLPAHTHSGITASAGSHTHTGSTDGAGGHTHIGITGTTGAHTHTGTALSAGSHDHIWARFFGASLTWRDGDGTEIINWADGMDSAGAGIYPLARDPEVDATFNTNSAGSHTHILSIAATGDHSHLLIVTPVGDHSHSLSIAAAGDHSHSLSISPDDAPPVTSSLQNHLPPYFGLLKIMRIK